MDFSTLADEIAAVSHRCWCKRMLEEGWRPGRVLDPDAMTHDGLRPYGDLSPEQRGRLRLRVTWDSFEQDLVACISDAYKTRRFSLRDMYVGMRVRCVDGDPDDIGAVVSWSPFGSEPDVLDRFTVAWPNGEVLEYGPDEDEVAPVDGPSDG